MTILFGILERNYSLQFSDLDNYFHNSASEKIQVKGINFEYGLQYRAKIADNYFFNAGLSLTTGKTYTSKYNYIAVRTSAYEAVDTISYAADESAPVFLPGTYRAGISFGKVKKFTTGFDFVSTSWSKAEIPGYGGYAANTKKFMWGLEIVPDRYSNFNFFKRIEYRVGAHLGDNYLIINGEQIKEMGATFGLGIPMKKTSLSRANFFFDITGKKGSEAAGMHDERIITIGASLNLYDWWFIQRRYD